MLGGFSSLTLSLWPGTICQVAHACSGEISEFRISFDVFWLPGGTWMTAPAAFSRSRTQMPMKAIGVDFFCVEIIAKNDQWTFWNFLELQVTNWSQGRLGSAFGIAALCGWGHTLAYGRHVARCGATKVWRFFWEWTFWDILWAWIDLEV